MQLRTLVQKKDNTARLQIAATHISVSLEMLDWHLIAVRCAGNGAGPWRLESVKSNQNQLATGL
jgi:hypothetical protein